MDSFRPTTIRMVDSDDESAALKGLCPVKSSHPYIREATRP
ncbi:hypothetical protein [Niveispirillum sp. SYP-B3756]|nr:hypothetical protein [Niveispirillum sp. SYP-B3756]